MTLRWKDVLAKTVTNYITETKKLLKFFEIDISRLEKYRERGNPMKRTPTLKPKLEYSALT